MRDDEQARGSAKSYPRHCSECGQTAVQATVISYSAETKHDGCLHQFQIPQLQVDRCSECSEIYFTTVSDVRLSFALRAHLGLLQAAEIENGLSALGLSQGDFAERIGVAPEVVARWLTANVVQSRPLDNLMRLFFANSDVREALSGSRHGGGATALL